MDDVAQERKALGIYLFYFAACPHLPVYVDQRRSLQDQRAHSPFPFGSALFRAQADLGWHETVIIGRTDENLAW